MYWERRCVVKSADPSIVSGLVYPRIIMNSFWSSFTKGSAMSATREKCEGQLIDECKDESLTEAGILPSMMWEIHCIVRLTGLPVVLQTVSPIFLPSFASKLSTISKREEGEGKVRDKYKDEEY